MRRVVVTGMGIVSCLGNNVDEVYHSLYEGKSKISFSQEYRDYNFRSQVVGAPQVDYESHISRKDLRFMTPSSAWAYMCIQECISLAGLTEDEVSNDRTGLVIGSGGSSTKVIHESALKTVDHSPKKIGPFSVPKTMSSMVAANIAVAKKIRGYNYSISSACATSTHCIGNAYQLIKYGEQDRVFAGGAEELDWSMSNLFDAMGAMSSKYNDSASTASRAFDKDRDGFVIAGGAGIIVLEEYEIAKKRGAKIYAEIVGYGATSDGYDMVQPSGEGAVRCIKMALQNVDEPIDYINPHATSTPIGDVKEMEACRKIFGDKIPTISATKSLSGHSLGAAGVHEAVYTLIMMDKNFICQSANIFNLDEPFKGLPITQERIDNHKIKLALSNSFGFGGTNATLVFRAMEE